jgi:hypothetical protein
MITKKVMGRGEIINWITGGPGMGKEGFGARS